MSADTAAAVAADADADAAAVSDSDCYVTLSDPNKSISNCENSIRCAVDFPPGC